MEPERIRELFNVNHNNHPVDDEFLSSKLVQDTIEVLMAAPFWPITQKVTANQIHYSPNWGSIDCDKYTGTVKFNAGLTTFTIAAKLSQFSTGNEVRIDLISAVSLIVANIHNTIINRLNACGCNRYVLRCMKDLRYCYPLLNINYINDMYSMIKADSLLNDREAVSLVVKRLHKKYCHTESK